jgi:hypothetical protein
MTDEDNIRRFEEELARKSRTIAVWTAVGTVLTLSALIYSSVHLASVRKQTKDAEASLKAKQSELKELDARLQRVNAQLTKAEQTSRVYGLTLSDISVNSPEETNAAFKLAVSQIPEAVGITIQIAYKSQLSKAMEIASQLRKLGYEVPPDRTIEIRGEHISNDNYVRYFFDSDATLARQIAEQIKTMGINVQPYSLVGAKDLGEVHPRTFEFRLGRQYKP